MVQTPGIGTPPSDKGASLGSASDPHPINHIGCGALCQPVIGVNTMIEVTLKVKITAAQLAAFTRFLLLLLVAIA